MSEERAVVFHCPYCAEEDLRPSELGPGAWACGACLRVFSVKLLSLRAGADGEAAPTRPQEAP